MMLVITATITLSLSPSPYTAIAWAKIIEEGKLNEQLQSLILIEPGFGLDLVEVEDAEVTGEDEE
jgi:hypothetical protein